MNSLHADVARTNTAEPAFEVAATPAIRARDRRTRIHSAGERFIVLSAFNDEAVLDMETHLIWERSPRADRAGWKAQLLMSFSRKTGDRQGWRMPTAEELRTLRASSVSGATRLPVGHPFTQIRIGSSDFYWTTTIWRDKFASVVSFGESSAVDGGNMERVEAPMWCVRGPGWRSC
jgi:hypothetical protein